MRLSSEAEKIVMLINKFGGASFEQIKEIVNDSTVDISKVAHFLALKQYLDIIDEKYVTARKHTTIDSADVDCLWAVIDSMKYENVFDYDTFKQTQTYNGMNGKVKMSFIKDANYIVNVAHIAKNNVIDVTFLQNRFYELNNVIPGKEKDKRIVHFFVTRSKDVVIEIKELGLKIPYVIILLTYQDMDASKKPDIQYISDKK